MTFLRRPGLFKGVILILSKLFSCSQLLPGNGGPYHLVGLLPLRIPVFPRGAAFLGSCGLVRSVFRAWQNFYVVSFLSCSLVEGWLQIL